MQFSLSLLPAILAAALITCPNSNRSDPSRQDGTNNENTTQSPIENAGAETASVATEVSNDAVVATVNGHPITAGEVRHFLGQRFKHLAQDELESTLQNPEILAAALRQLIHRLIVLERVRQAGMVISDEAVQLEIRKFSNELQKVSQTIDGYLTENQITRQQFEFEIQWRISWKNFLDASLSDEYLERHFNRFRRRFDGTQLRVAQLLLKEKSSENIEKLNEIRTAVSDGSALWIDAVEQYSLAPSKSNEGVVGWISIDGPMDPAFTKAAFQLTAGEISPVVDSPFGVHLIKCVEVRPGKNELGDVLDIVRADAMESGFAEIVATNIEDAEIEFSGNWPWIDREGTLQLPREKLLQEK